MKDLVIYWKEIPKLYFLWDTISKVRLISGKHCENFKHRYKHVMYSSTPMKFPSTSISLAQRLKCELQYHKLSELMQEQRHSRARYLALECSIHNIQILNVYQWIEVQLNPYHVFVLKTGVVCKLILQKKTIQFTLLAPFLCQRRSGQEEFQMWTEGSEMHWHLVTWNWQEKILLSNHQLMALENYTPMTALCSLLLKQWTRLASAAKQNLC